MCRCVLPCVCGVCLTLRRLYGWLPLHWGVFDQKEAGRASL